MSAEWITPPTPPRFNVPVDWNRHHPGDGAFRAAICRKQESYAIAKMTARCDDKSKQTAGSHTSMLTEFQSTRNPDHPGDGALRAAICRWRPLSSSRRTRHSTERLLHLNVCPQNVVVTKRGMWKLTGLCFTQNIGTDLQQSNVRTVRYIDARTYSRRQGRIKTELGLILRCRQGRRVVCYRDNTRLTSVFNFNSNCLKTCT